MIAVAERISGCSVYTQTQPLPLIAEITVSYVTLIILTSLQAGEWHRNAAEVRRCDQGGGAERFVVFQFGILYLLTSFMGYFN